MPFLALDHSFVTNPKIAGLSDRAFRLHVLALCHCAEHMTDGLVEVSSKLWVKVGGNIRRTEELVQAKLWVEVDGGWQIHDYLDWNASSAQIKEKRRKDRARKLKKAYPDSARIPDGNGEPFRADSAGTTPREPSIEGSLSGEPAKSVRPRKPCAQCGLTFRSKPLLDEHVYNSHDGPEPAHWTAEPAAEPLPLNGDPELPPPEERARIAAELRASLLAAKPADPSTNGAVPAEELPWEGDEPPVVAG